MPTVETLVTQWRSLYAEWVLAELQLREAHKRGHGGRALAVLEARVRQLQRECDAALDATSAALSSTGADRLAVQAQETFAAPSPSGAAATAH